MIISRSVILKKFGKNNPTVSQADFLAKVEKIANNLNVKVDWLLNIFWKETRETMLPSVQSAPGKSYNHVGLIQFGSSAASQLKTTLLALMKMDALTQLDYVEKYYLSFYKWLKITNPGTIENFYMLTLYPKAYNYTQDQNLPYKIAKDNRSLTQDNKGIVLSKQTIKDHFYNLFPSKTLAQAQVNTIAAVNSAGSSTNTPPTTYTKLEGTFSYTHSDARISTLSGIIEFNSWKDPDNPSKAIDSKKLLAIQDSYGKSNTQKIRELYPSILDIAEGSEDLRVENGTHLTIPYACLDLQNIVGVASTTVVEQHKLSSIISENLKALLRSPLYKQDLLNAQLGDLTKEVPQISVWIYCKSAGDYVRSLNNGDTSIQGELIDISPFIESLTTGTSATGGNFSIKLAPIIGECSKKGWTFSKGSVTQFSNSDDFVAKQSAFTLNKGELLRNKLWLHNLIQQNDLVFIRFEKLQLEKDRILEARSISTPLSFNDIPSTSVFPKVYDMVGLVSTNSSTFVAANTDESITISGMDLIKPLIEDGTYWFNTVDALQTVGVVKNQDDESWGRVRRRIEGEWSASGNPIEDLQYDTNTGALAKVNVNNTNLAQWVNYIISRLATTEIVPDKIFQGYGDRISTYSAITLKNGKSQPQTFKAAGIWQIMKIIFDQSARNRTIYDISLATHEGSLLAGIQKYCDGKFIELMADTYGDQYFLTIRKPPYDYKSVSEAVDLIFNENGGCESLQIDGNQVLIENLEWETTFYSWYRLRSVTYIEGEQKEYIRDFLPIIYFKEYNEVFGNKSCDITSGYLPFIPYYRGLGNKTPDYDLSVLQIKQDLRFLIESSAYLPFTRKGTIILHGDRRIKRGVWCYYKPSQEIFYIDAVSQSYVAGSTDRTTTLQVSRGMRYINEDGQTIWPKYFQIIDFQDEEPKQEAKKSSETVEVYDSLFQFDTDKFTFIQPYSNELTTDDEKDINIRLEQQIKSQNQIIKSANDLLNDKSLKIEVKGHTDQDKTHKYGDKAHLYIGGNRKLSKKRAEYVLNQLKSKFLQLGGLKADFNKRVSATSFAEDRPRADVANLSPIEQKKANRRVSLTYIRTIVEQNKDNLGKSYPWRVDQENFLYFIRRKQMCNNDRAVSAGSIEPETVLPSNQVKDIEYMINVAPNVNVNTIQPGL